MTEINQWIRIALSQRAHTYTEHIPKTRFQDIQNIVSKDVHNT